MKWLTGERGTALMAVIVGLTITYIGLDLLCEGRLSGSYWGPIEEAESITRDHATADQEQ